MMSVSYVLRFLPQGEKKRTELLVDPRGCLIFGIRTGTSPPFAFLPEGFDDLNHLFPGATSINHLITHAHGHLLSGVGVQQALHQQVSHQDAHKDTAVVSVLLLRAVVDGLVPQRHADQFAQLFSRAHTVQVVGAAQRVVVEGDAIDLGDEQ